MSAKLLDGRLLAAEILGAARREARAVKARRGRAPRLAIICADGPAARSYQQARLSACSDAEVDIVLHRLSPGPRAKTLGLLADVAADKAVDALLLETPYPRGLTADDICAAVPPAKDAEGVSPATYGRLFLAKTWREAAQLPGPCTAFALALLALRAQVSLRGLRALVIGRSATVGRPTAHLLSTLDLTVTLGHSRTRDLRALCRAADVLVAAVGEPGLVKPDWIKRGAVVLDAGVHEVRGRLTGDVAPGAATRAAFLTPVPGGVGPVTTAYAVLQAARLAARSCP